MSNCINGRCSGGDNGGDDGRNRMFMEGRGGLFYPAGRQGLGNGDPLSVCGNQSGLPTPGLTCPVPGYTPSKVDITFPPIPCPAINNIDF